MRKICVLLVLSTLAGPGRLPAGQQEEAGRSEEVVFFVSGEGSDEWSGGSAQPNAEKNDGPFVTLEAACRAARKAGTQKARRIVVQQGRYFLNEVLSLDEKDSGLTIEAAEGGQVRLFGGRQIGGWERDGEKFYSAAIPAVRQGKWDFRALIVNGRFCARARVPEEGTFTHESKFQVPWMSSTGGGWKRKPTEEELTGMVYRQGDLGPWLDVNNAELTVYHMWDESLVGVEAIDTAARTVIFSDRSGHPPGAFGVRKYVVWNVREGMTRPGQWYLDRSAGKVVYWPIEAEDMSKAEVFAPVVQSIIKIEGSREKPAEGITIRGLKLSVTNTPLKTGGFGAGRFDGAVSLFSAKNCRVIDLEIVNVGGQGIKASGDGLRIEKCHVHHTGACGIKFMGTDASVTDNHIHDVGLTYPSAIALWGGGKDSLIGHNEIHETPYTAINCGGENNRIEHNLIYRAMLELHDGGGIYCFAGKNLVLRGNFIRDITDTGGYGSSAYYLDERSENCVVEGNVSLRVARPSHNHMAKNNTVRNNVFITEADARLTFPKSSGYTLEKNVIYAGGKITLENPEAITALKDNVLFSKTGQIECRKLQDYSTTETYQLQAGQDNVPADPKLIEFEKGKIRFAGDSAAVKLGIEAVDVSGAGPRGN